MLPACVESAVYGLVVTPAVHLADKYGLLELLRQGGPSHSAKLAEETSTDPETADRLLTVLVGAGLLLRQPDGRYALDPAAAPYFDRSDPAYVGAFVAHQVEVAAVQLNRLEDYLRRGKKAVEVALPEPFERLYADADSTEDFMNAMWGLSYGVSQELAELADLSTARDLVDVGGANGPFSVAALQRYPDLHATVFDLEPVERHVIATAHTHGLVDRLSFVAGDFFRDKLPVADVMAFGYVMSDWPDEQCRQLLDSAYRSCRPGGWVLIMDRLFNADRSGPLATSVMNLTMQVEANGRHRTADEFASMLTTSGFIEPQVRYSSQDKHLVTGRRPAE